MAKCRSAVRRSRPDVQRSDAYGLCRPPQGTVQSALTMYLSSAKYSAARQLVLNNTHGVDRPAQHFVRAHGNILAQAMAASGIEVMMLCRRRIRDTGPKAIWGCV